MEEPKLNSQVCRYPPQALHLVVDVGRKNVDKRYSGMRGAISPTTRADATQITDGPDEGCRGLLFITASSEEFELMAPCS